MDSKTPMMSATTNTMKKPLLVFGVIQSLLLKIRFFACVIISLPLITTASGEKNDAYTITFNGEEPDYYYIRPLKNVGWEDDRFVLDLLGWILLMEGEGEYHFSTDSNKVGRLYLEIDGEKELVGISYHDSRDYAEDSFADLQPENIRKLRGISLAGELNYHIIDLLNQVDPDKAFVSFREPSYPSAKDPGIYPPLNPRIKFLQSSVSSSPNHISYEHLKDLRSLEYLNLYTSVNKIDYDWLRNCTNLKYLNLSMKRVGDLSYLEGLQELRYLNLSYCREVNTIELVRSLPNLRHLIIYRTPVQDLTPIQDLKHIKTVDAGESAVCMLPSETVESLIELRVMSSKIDAEEVEAFIEKNPQCKVIYDWNLSLQSALEGIDKFRVRSGGTCCNDIETETTLFETDDQSKIKLLCSNIAINPEESGFACKCCGTPTLEFYKDGELAVVLGYHHGQSLRWAEGEWTGDGLLTKESKDFLLTWLDEHGVSEPKEGVEEDRREAERSKVIWDKWMEAMPASIRPLFKDALRVRPFKDVDIEPLSLALVNEMPDQKQRILSLLKWYGSGEGPWSPHRGYESVAETMLLEYDTEYIVAAIESTDLTEAQLEGAARLFAGNKFRRERPTGLNKVPLYMKQMFWDHVKPTEDKDKLRRAKSAFK